MDRPTDLRRRLVPLLAIAGVVLALDQGTKIAVRGWLERGDVWPSPDWPIVISRVENTGAAFGILQGQTSFLIVTTVIALGAILAYVFLAPLQGRLYVAGFGLVIGGAFGNLTDRIFRGSVTDFIDPARYPAFNIADSAIVVGVITLILLSFFEDRFTDRNEEPVAAAPPDDEAEFEREFDDARDGRVPRDVRPASEVPAAARNPEPDR
jgi:signal peptidase II